MGVISAAVLRQHPRANAKLSAPAGIGQAIRFGAGAKGRRLRDACSKDDARANQGEAIFPGSGARRLANITTLSVLISASHPGEMAWRDDMTSGRSVGDGARPPAGVVTLTKNRRFSSQFGSATSAVRR
jgi:hypothetical protein